MTITIAFERWELEYLSDVIAADNDCSDLRLLREKLIATRDLMRQEEEATLIAQERQHKLWKSLW